MTSDDSNEQERPPAAQTSDLSKRLQDVDVALERARLQRQADAARSSRSATDNRGFAVALRLSSEFIAGVVVGGGLGWLIDRGLGTSPWGMIVCLFLGFAAGVLNVMRSAGLAGQGLGGTASKGSAVSPDDKGE